MNKDRRRTISVMGFRLAARKAIKLSPYSLQRVNRLGLRALRCRSDQAELVSMKLTTRTVRHTKAASHSLRTINKTFADNYDSEPITASSDVEPLQWRSPDCFWAGQGLESQRNAF
jgi:hypothetical protein